MQPQNPLFKQPDDDEKPEDQGYLLSRPAKAVQPIAENMTKGAVEAANLIREKLARLYTEEPDPIAEEAKAEAAKPRSKHQQFMYDLSTSGKNIAEIQTAWHAYYVGLPDEEKHQVWQEFYAASDAAQHHRNAAKNPLVPALPAQPRHLAPMTKDGVTVSHEVEWHPPDSRTTSEIRSRIRRTVSANGRLSAKHHLQSLTFGLSLGFITLVIFLFGFFNEVIIAPFLQPARTVGATPIIVDPNTVVASKTPEIIIPKINLEIPVDFSQTSTDETDIENALEKGIVHYPSTVLPGETGNTAFFGHSSNNIFNPGKYKFAFVLLHELVPGDTFYITYKGKAYVYKVFSRQIVDPSDVGVLDDVRGHRATATLITCDPPGTSLHRLIVVGDQVSPDPLGNTHGDNTTQATTDSSSQLPGNGPSLLERILTSIF